MTLQWCGCDCVWFDRSLQRTQTPCSHPLVVSVPSSKCCCIVLIDSHSALGAFIVSACAVIKALIFAFRKDSSVLADDERAPRTCPQCP